MEKIKGISIYSVIFSKATRGPYLQGPLMTKSNF